MPHPESMSANAKLVLWSRTLLSLPHRDSLNIKDRLPSHWRIELEKWRQDVLTPLSRLRAAFALRQLIFSWRVR